MDHRVGVPTTCSTSNESHIIEGSSSHVETENSTPAAQRSPRRKQPAFSHAAVSCILSSLLFATGPVLAGKVKLILLSWFLLASSEHAATMKGKSCTDTDAFEFASRTNITKLQFHFVGGCPIGNHILHFKLVCRSWSFHCPVRSHIPL